MTPTEKDSRGNWHGFQQKYALLPSFLWFLAKGQYGQSIAIGMLGKICTMGCLKRTIGTIGIFSSRSMPYFQASQVKHEQQIDVTGFSELTNFAYLTRSSCKTLKATLHVCTTLPCII